MSLIRSARAIPRAKAAAFSTTFVRTKVTLPPLDYDFGALEPHISGQINELHYTKHHQTYANNFNAASEQFAEAVKDGNVHAQVNLLPIINFNGGGFTNHNLFWKNLAPPKEGGGEPPVPESKLAQAIEAKYGSLANLQADVNTRLAGIQGSGWAWIVKSDLTNDLSVITTPNQDVVPKGLTPIIGIDAWEHAYYLQYKNVKVDYFKAIWNVINWQEGARRFEA